MKTITPFLTPLLAVLPVARWRLVRVPRRMEKLYLMFG
jgi:hypothetical protein